MWQVTYKNRKDETESYYFHYKFMANLTVWISKFLKRSDISVSEYIDHSTKSNDKLSDNNKYIMSSIICKNLPIEGRVYDEDSLKHAFKDYVERFKSDKSGFLLGELNHSHHTSISLQNVSHKIIEAEMNSNDDLALKFELLNTPQGQIAKKLFDSGVDMVISPKIIGESVEDVDENGNGLGTYHTNAEHIISFDLIKPPIE